MRFEVELKEKWQTGRVMKETLGVVLSAYHRRNLQYQLLYHAQNLHLQVVYVEFTCNLSILCIIYMPAMYIIIWLIKVLYKVYIIILIAV